MAVLAGDNESSLELLRFEAAPALEMAPNDNAPLVGLLTLETNQPTSVIVTLDDGSSVSTIEFYLVAILTILILLPSCRERAPKGKPAAWFVARNSDDVRLVRQIETALSERRTELDDCFRKHQIGGDGNPLPDFPGGYNGVLYLRLHVLGTAISSVRSSIHSIWTREFLDCVSDLVSNVALKDSAGDRDFSLAVGFDEHSGVSLRQADVANVLWARQHEIDQCLLLSKSDNLARATLGVQFFISRDGKPFEPMMVGDQDAVTSIEAKTCLMDIISSSEFPRSEEGRKAIAHYTFFASPQ